MKFDFSWIVVANPKKSDDWNRFGILVRDSNDVVSFHPRPGFETPAAELVGACERASAKGEGLSIWEYLQDRALGGLSTIDEPATEEASDRATLVARLLTEGAPEVE